MFRCAVNLSPEMDVDALKGSLWSSRMASELVLDRHFEGCQIPAFGVLAIVEEDTSLDGQPRERVVVGLTVVRNRYGGTGHTFVVPTSNGVPVDESRGWESLKDWMLERLDEGDDA
jgi:hypothetical protein